MKRNKFVLTDLNNLGATHFRPFETHVWVATHTLGIAGLVRTHTRTRTHTHTHTFTQKR